MNDIYLSDFLVEKEQTLSANSLIAYKRDLKSFMKFLDEKNKMPIKAVSNIVISDYLLTLKGEGKKEATINRRIVVLHLFFEYLCRYKIAKNNPMKNICKLPGCRVKIIFLSIMEINTLLETARHEKNLRDIAILELLYSCGIRVSELVMLSQEACDFKFGSSIKVTSEMGKTRLVPIGIPAAEALQKYLKSTERAKVLRKESKGILFLNHRGNRLSRQSVWNICRDSGKSAGLKKEVTPIILRDTFAMHMLQNGADALVVREIMGVSEAVSFDGYLMLIKNRTKEVFTNCHPRAF